jgi:hypothetical protein
MRRFIRNALVISATLLVPLIAVPAQANAATATLTASDINSCPSDGYIDAWDRCTTLSNGILLINNGSTLAHVEYDKDGGSSIYAKLGYESAGTNHWASYQTMTAGGVYDYDFSFSSNCYTREGLLYDSGSGSLFQTPSADSC